MGRPDLTAVRTEEILDAFEHCVARYGLHGSSLERVAEQAGMKRSVVRHYMGNRDEMIVALAERVTAECHAQLETYVASASEQLRVDQLLAFFFPNTQADTTDSLMAVESLIAAAEDYPRVQELMTGYVEEMVNMTTDQLRLAHPNATKAQCWTVAYGVVGICYNHASLAPLALPTKYLKAARASARALTDTLSS